jgi:magnesium chelatase family protein
LACDGQLSPKLLAEFVMLGELALDGSLRAVAGTLPMLIAAKRAGIGRAIVPLVNHAEAALIPDVQTYAVPTLADAVAVVLGNGEKFRIGIGPAPAKDAETGGDDFADVRGQLMAKRALEIAAAGGHNVILVGPPGCGKTMLARRMPSILPPMTQDESLDVTAIYSIAGLLGSDPHIVGTRPFRAPHHTSSRIALVGARGNHARLTRRALLG